MKEMPTERLEIFLFYSFHDLTGPTEKNEMMMAASVQVLNGHAQDNRHNLHS